MHRTRSQRSESLTMTKQAPPVRSRWIAGSAALGLAVLVLVAMNFQSAVVPNRNADSAGIDPPMTDWANARDLETSTEAKSGRPIDARNESMLSAARGSPEDRALRDLADLALRARAGDLGAFERLQGLLSFCRYIEGLSHPASGSGSTAATGSEASDNNDASTAYVLARSEQICPQSLPVDLTGEYQYWAMRDEMLQRTTSDELRTIEALSTIDAHESDAEEYAARDRLERIALETTSPEILERAAHEIISGRHGAWSVGQDAIEGTLSQGRLAEFQLLGAILAACDRGADCGPASLRYMRLCAPNHCIPGEDVYAFVGKSVSSIESAAVVEVRDWFRRR